ncbi:endonuclease/exonuclease/phosphatase family protein, partial [Trifolium medium]|nr:endonuclease/exonuclease/phosphatase family protein [Trifolium medium]
MIHGQEGLCQIAKEYFADLFQQALNEDDEVTDLMKDRVTEEDNQNLTTEFKMEEFKKAVFSMHSDKAPGPDGLNLAFFKRFWDMCGQEIFSACTKWAPIGE